MGRRSNKQKQTTLGFDPVGSSSPRASALSTAVRSRAAAVTYKDGRAKRKRVEFEDGEVGLNDIPQDIQPLLPTPAASSQLPSNSRKSKKRRRQGKLDFAFHHTTDNSTYSPILSPPRTLEAQAGAASKTEEPLSSASKARPRAGIFGKSRNTALVESSEEDSDMVNTRSSTKKRRLEKAAPKPAVESESESDLATPVRKTKKREGPATRHSTKRSIAKPVVTISSGDEDSADELPDAATLSASAKKAAAADIAEPESSGDEVMRSSPTVKSRGRLLGKRAKKDDFIVDDEEEVEENSDESDVAPRSARKKVVKLDSDREDGAGNESSSGSESDDVEPVTPSKRLRKGRREKEDLDEDLEFLRSSPPSTVRRNATPRVSARQKALDLLKQRRAANSGTPKAVTRPNDEEDSDLEIVEDDGDDEALSAIDEDEGEGEDEEDEDEEWDEWEQPTTFRDLNQANEEDEEFIVSDADEPVDLAKMDIPIHLTAHGRMKSKELFKYAVEWMVQKKINPAFRMEDEVYRLAFRKLDDEVQGLSSSKFMSSVWRQEFTFALTARPKIIAIEMSRGERDVLGAPGCDACGRQTHPATWQISFDGKPYRVQTLDNVSDDEDSDSDADNTCYDAQGREIPPESRTWNVGVHCKTNAETAHTLHHWRYHLNEWIIDWLLHEGYLTKEKVFERDGWSTKKKRKFANQIVDAMEQKSEIQALYMDFRSNVDNARDAKQYRPNHRRR